MWLPKKEGLSKIIMRALITGISGFVGGALTDLLLGNGWEVAGFDHRKSDKIPQIHLGNILDKKALLDSLKVCQPDVVFHLAGVIKTQTPADYYSVHVLGTLTLFEALIEIGVKPKVIIASTSAVYGPGFGKHPISEHFALRPVTDYGASKMAEEIVAQRFFLAYNFPVINVRTFNLIGPGQSPELACSAFARQIALDEKQKSSRPIQTGNLNTKRDFVDIRDAVQAYVLLANKGQAGGTYNVCSGQTVSLQRCLDILLSMAKRPLTTEIDPARIQKNDVAMQIGCAELIEQTIGWRPHIPIKQSLLDLLNDWRRRLNSNRSEA